MAPNALIIWTGLAPLLRLLLALFLEGRAVQLVHFMVCAAGQLAETEHIQGGGRSSALIQKRDR